MSSEFIIIPGDQAYFVIQVFLQHAHLATLALLQTVHYQSPLQLTESNLQCFYLFQHLFHQVGSAAAC